MTRVLLATAELDPFVKVGGLGEAMTGLARSLHQLGVTVEIAVPDYPLDIPHTDAWSFSIPEWAGGAATVRSATIPGTGVIHAISVPGMARPHPYVNPETGQGWEDNDRRFYAFSAAVAQLAHTLPVDVLHLNDWHSALAVAWFPPERTVLSIHNLAHQGVGDLGWIDVIGDQGPRFEHLGSFNPLAGAIRLARRVTTVSPRYAIEACTEEFGCGLQDELLARGKEFFGIRNGIDGTLWNPTDDPYLPANFSTHDLSGKQICRKELRRITGLDDAPGPTIGMVTRFVDQKGIDLVTEVLDFLAGVPASLVMHGTGDLTLMSNVTHGSRRLRQIVAYRPGFDEGFAHLVTAGSDLLLVPSRFEPCGLTQMQAMTCGTIPVVTAVGGLADTVIDTDAAPNKGTGFVASSPSVPAVLDALHRGVRGWRNPRRRAAIQRRGMRTDWTWRKPARQYRRLYDELASAA